MILVAFSNSEEDQRVFDAAFQQWQFAQRQEVLSPAV